MRKRILQAMESWKGPGTEANHHCQSINGGRGLKQEIDPKLAQGLSFDKPKVARAYHLGNQNWPGLIIW